MGVEGLLADAEHLALHAVGVGDDGAAKVLRAPGDVRHAVRDEPARHRLGERQREPPLAEQAAGDLFERDRSLAVDVGTDALADARREDLEPGGSRLRLPVDDEAKGYLREARAERDARFGRIHRAGHLLVERRLGEPERLEDARQVHVAAAQRTQPGEHRLLHHHLHLARHAGQDDEVTATMLDAVSGRRAERVRNHHGTPGQQRLLQVVLGHLAAERGEELADALGGWAVLGERYPEDARHDLVGEVVRRGPDPAGRDDDLGLLERVLPRPHEAVGIVADGEHGDEVQAEREELIGDPARIAVDDAARRQLVAGRENGDALDHATIRRHRRVTSPA